MNDKPLALKLFKLIEKYITHRGKKTALLFSFFFFTNPSTPAPPMVDMLEETQTLVRPDWLLYLKGPVCVGLDNKYRPFF